MATLSSRDPELWKSLREVPAKMNAFLASTAATVRKTFGVVKVLEDGRGSEYPDMTWEPKASFHALAGAYAG